MLFYRFLLTALSPLFALLLLVRLATGRERVADLTERFARDLRGTTTSCAPTLWVHGASNGELTSAKSLIEEALTRAPGMDILVTVNTVTARKMVANWGLPRVQVRLAPMDLRGTLKRFLRTYRPVALVTLENEIWPNRFALLQRAKTPILVAGARMSETSAKRWEALSPLLGGTAKRSIAAITYLAAQDLASEQRLLQMGVPARILLPRMNLKATVEMSADGHKDAKAFAKIFDRDMTFLAASTHEGEERIAIAAFAHLRKEHPSARMILAPRHPLRAGEVAEELQRAGLAFARRSQKSSPKDAPVFLADTLGEMALWYGLAGVSFVGGSLVPKGGHTPFEPAQCDSAILHGPHVSNHQAAYDALDHAEAARQVTSVEGLSETLCALMRDPAKAQDMTTKAHTVTATLRDGAASREAFWAALAQCPGIPTLSTK